MVTNDAVAKDKPDSPGQADYPNADDDADEFPFGQEGKSHGHDDEDHDQDGAHRKAQLSIF